MSADTVNRNLIYLSLGSNLGDKLKNIVAASELIWKLLGNQGVVSQVFESSSWGYSSENLFYNCCLSLTTNLDPFSVMEEILEIEKILGRERGSKGYSDRLIDIDLLFFGDLILHHPRLTIPHPSIRQRRFILEPLSKIAPDLIHPQYGISILTMLEQCKDTGAVWPI